MKRAVSLAALLLVAMLVPATAPALATSTSSTECSNSVTYDEFRFDNSTVSSAANTSATVEKENTMVSVTQTTGFVRLHAENPNGYCKTVTVTLAQEIVTAAELGNIESNEENVTASWHATRDFQRNVTYTEVTFTLEPASEATFAPSTIRVQSLAWTGTATSVSSSLLDGVDIPYVGEKKNLTKRTYRFSPENNSTTYITVPLKNASTGQKITDWQAMYRPSPSASWRPIGQDASAPVFYRQPDEAHVQFVFNDPNAQVKFTANPSRLEEADHQLDSYLAGASEILEKLNIDL